MTTHNGQLVPCARCKTNPASALWQTFTKKGKPSRKFNLCAGCGFTIHTWIKMWSPPSLDDMGDPLLDEQGREIHAEPVFYHPYVRAEIVGKPDASFTQARTRGNVTRAVPLTGAALSGALARFGLRL